MLNLGIILAISSQQSLYGWSLFETPKTDQEVLTEAQERKSEIESDFKEIYEAYQRYKLAERAGSLEKEHYRSELVNKIQGIGPRIHGRWNRWTASGAPLERFAGTVVDDTAKTLESLIKELAKRQLCDKPESKNACQEFPEFIGALKDMKAIIMESPAYKAEKDNETIASLTSEVKSTLLTLGLLRDRYNSLSRENDRLRDKLERAERALRELQQRCNNWPFTR